MKRVNLAHRIVLMLECVDIDTREHDHNLAWRRTLAAAIHLELLHTGRKVL